MPDDLTCSAGHAVSSADTPCPLCSTSVSSFPDRIPPLTAPVLPVIPGYEVLGELGRGGMGVVYKARQISLDRIVALKMILAGPYADADEVGRLRQEAKALGRLQHPNIVQIYEVGEQGGWPFCALEVCDGGSLDKKLGGAPLPAREAARLAETLARAVAAAHQRGIVHRDLKPHNVLLTADGTLKITDFGLAKKMDEQGRTATGAVLGTPSYMAPEQARGHSGEVGPAADVYALGAILYQLLTGRPPFRAATALDTMLQVLTLDPVPPRQLRPDVPRDLETICLTCLHKEPRRRYASAAALADDLRRFQEGRPVVVRRVSTAERLALWAQRRPAAALAAGLMVLAAALGVGGGAAVWFWRGAEEARGQAEHARDGERRAKELAEGEKADADDARDRAEGEKEKADKARADAEEARGREKKAREDLARADALRQVDLAYREWTAHRVVRADRLLDDCPPDLRGWEWRHVKRLCHAELAAWKACDGAVRAVAFSPDGKTLAVAPMKGLVQLCDAETGRPIRTLGDGQPVDRVAFRANGRQVVGACSSPAGATTWDVETGKEVGRLREFTDEGCEAALSFDGKRLAGVREPDDPDDKNPDRTVQAWDTETRSSSSELKVSRPGDKVRALAFSTDGKLLAARLRGTVHVWDVDTGAKRGTAAVPSGAEECLALGPDGKLLAVGDDTVVRVQNPADGSARFALAGHAGAVTLVAFSPDGTRLASASNSDATVRLWDLKARRELRVLGGHNAVKQIVFCADGKRLASAADDGTVKVWDATAGEEEAWPRLGARALVGHAQNVGCVAFSPNGTQIASGSRDGTAKVWDLNTGRVFRSLRFSPGHDQEVVAVAFRPDGRGVAGAGEFGGIKIWDAEADRVLVSAGWEGAFGLKDLAFSPDGARLAGAVSDGVRVWDADSGRLLQTPAVGEGLVRTFTSVAFSPDGKRLAGGAYGEARVWDAATGRLLRTEATGRPGAPTFVAFSRDGKHLAVSDRWTLSVSDAETGRKVRTFSGDADAFGRCAFSADGTRLVSCAWDQTVRLWDLETGRETLALTGHAGVGSVVAFSPDGDRLASPSGDHTVQIWDARPLRP